MCEKPINKKNRQVQACKTFYRLQQEHLRAQQHLLEQEQAIVHLQHQISEQGEPLELSMRGGGEGEEPEPGEITGGGGGVGDGINAANMTTTVGYSLLFWCRVCFLLCS